MDEFVAWLTLLLAAHWFFGNLYEAVAFMPNLMSILELKARAGKALFKTKWASPVAYYVPAGALTLGMSFALAAAALLRHQRGSSYLLAACGLLFLGGALTFYTVRHVNLDLFFQPQTDLHRARRLLTSWSRLNYIRLSLVGAAIATLILWLRTSLKP
jgi:hypothetical protein